jgi:hypothetical protein
MSGNDDKPSKRRRSTKRRLIPLLMLGSDGEAYACAPAHLLPRGVLENPQTICAIRLSHRERAVALDALQVGIKEAAETLEGIVGRKLDS